MGGIQQCNGVVADLPQEYADLIAIIEGEAFKARMYEESGRLTPDQVINTWPPSRLQRLLRKGWPT